jgi:hypothetical protein
LEVESMWEWVVGLVVDGERERWQRVYARVEEEHQRE